MAQSPFVDHVKLFLKSGKGGAGAVAWRREKYVPKGGPDGGDGGDGGSIFLEGNSQMWTLLDLRYRKHIKAEKGQPGAGAKKTGKQGKDTILKVPLGTVALNAETGETLGEVKEDGDRLLLLEGGVGGKGNWRFKSSTNQAPEYAEPGGNAREISVVLELKVLADVGLVGFPNAGKSTLLSVMTAARPKIGAYPFTTLVPNLGIVKYRDFRSFVIADIPGIIEGASKGKGLGITFLRHIERNAVLLLLIPADSEKPFREYEILMKELEAYNPELMNKKILLSISKADLLTDESRQKIEKKFGEDRVHFFSAVTGEGLDALKDILWKALNPD